MGQKYIYYDPDVLCVRKIIIEKSESLLSQGNSPIKMGGREVRNWALCNWINWLFTAADRHRAKGRVVAVLDDALGNEWKIAVL